MLKINQEKCKKCQICAKNCPIGAIAVERQESRQHHEHVC